MQTINIVTAIDHNFVQHMIVMLTSIKKNANRNYDFRIYVIVDSSFEEENYRLIRECSELMDLNIELIQFNSSLIEGFSLHGHFSLAAYYRVYIAELLDDNVGKVIYIDSDIICNVDISELWKIELESKVIGAVRDLASPQMCELLGIDPGYTYFNSGVLLINLDLWRQLQLTEMVTQYIKNSEFLRFVDQDALNASLFDQVKIIEDQWNAQTNMFIENVFDKQFNIPHIIHYTTASKPWHVSNIHPLKSEYYKYLAHTPFKDFDPLKEASKKLISSKKCIFIFNAGELGGNLEQALGGITGFIDNDPKKWNTIKNGLPVYSIAEVIAKYSKADVGVLIPSVYHKEMSKQLEEHGLVRDVDFVVQF